jgi:hypothetical protein
MVSAACRRHPLSGGLSHRRHTHRLSYAICCRLGRRQAQASLLQRHAQAAGPGLHARGEQITSVWDAVPLLLCVPLSTNFG